jgi:hypothetical protein
MEMEIRLCTMFNSLAHVAKTGVSVGEKAALVLKGDEEVVNKTRCPGLNPEAGSFRTVNRV